MSVVQAPEELVPFLKESTERVLEANDLDESLTMTCGLPVERMNIDSVGVTVSAFRRFSNPTTENRNQHIRLVNQHAIENVDGIEFVWDRSEALERDTWCTWVMTDGEAIEYPHPFIESETASDADHIRLPTDLYVYERTPFRNSVQSIEQLENELESALTKFADGGVSLMLE